MIRDLLSTGLASLASFALLSGALACGNGPTGTGLTLVALPPWDGGADAGCTVASSSVKAGCATTYEITGDPRNCAGFDGAGSGSTATCQVLCKSGLTCNLSGLSDGTSVVACQSTCSSPEH